jgi:predicted nucleotide-binding protein
MRKQPKVKPRVFVGSSVESLAVAYAIQENLENDAEVTVWPQGIFELSKTAVESLIRALNRSDFAIFVFAPNDTLKLRQKKHAAVRDNVIFEFGLFIGKLGRSRTFIVVPKDQKDLRIPTDLMALHLGNSTPNEKTKTFSLP